MKQPFRVLVALCSLLALTIAATAVHAQDQRPLVTPNYRDADIRAVAEQLQQLIGRPIRIDPRVSARLTLLSSQPMAPEVFYDLFRSALEVHGLVALDAGDAIEIVPAADQRTGR